MSSHDSVPYRFLLPLCNVLLSRYKYHNTPLSNNAAQILESIDGKPDKHQGQA